MRRKARQPGERASWSAISPVLCLCDGCRKKPVLLATKGRTEQGAGDRRSLIQCAQIRGLPPTHPAIRTTRSLCVLASLAARFSGQRSSCRISAARPCARFATSVMKSMTSTTAMRRVNQEGPDQQDFRMRAFRNVSPGRSSTEKKPAGPPLQKPSSQPTLRRRGMDSNVQFRVR